MQNAGKKKEWYAMQCNANATLKMQRKIGKNRTVRNAEIEKQRKKRNDRTKRRKKGNKRKK